MSEGIIITLIICFTIIILTWITHDTDKGGGDK
jgi:hypothetical protein